MALPEEVLTKADRQLGREHVATSGSRGEGEVLRCRIRGPGDGLSLGSTILEPWVLGDGFESRLHHQGPTVVGLDRGGQ